MNTITHAFAPVVIVATVQLIRKKPLDWKILLYIALAGAAPDLLDPHITLEARLSSWSHSLTGMGALCSLLIFASIAKSIPWGLTIWMIIAYGLHLFCDAIAGGIGLFRPFNTAVIGDYYIMPYSWIIYDGVCILSLFIIWDLNRKWHGSQLLWWK